MSEDREKIVSFPKQTKHRRDKTDKDHVQNVHKAWRALQRAIADARNFGLDVDTNFSTFDKPPIVSRHYR